MAGKQSEDSGETGKTKANPPSSLLTPRTEESLKSPTRPGRPPFPGSRQAQAHQRLLLMASLLMAPQRLLLTASLLAAPQYLLLTASLLEAPQHPYKLPPRAFKPCKLLPSSLRAASKSWLAAPKPHCTSSSHPNLLGVCRLARLSKW